MKQLRFIKRSLLLPGTYVAYCRGVHPIIQGGLGWHCDIPSRKSPGAYEYATARTLTRLDQHLEELHDATLAACVAPTPTPAQAEATAYDYHLQKWLTGPAAVTLRRSQLETDLALLRGPGGARYAHFIGIGDIVATIARLAEELRGLS